MLGKQIERMGLKILYIRRKQETLTSHLTLKFNLSVLQSKVGKSADFVLLVKDNIHNENAVPCSPLAGKTLVCSQGELGKRFFQWRTFL